MGPDIPDALLRLQHLQKESNPKPKEGSAATTPHAGGAGDPGSSPEAPPATLLNLYRSGRLDHFADRESLCYTPPESHKFYAGEDDAP